MTAHPPLAVGIVEDDRGTREGLAALVSGTAGFRCVGTYVSVEEALKGWPDAVPDVLLLDIHLPGVSGSLGVRALRERFARMPMTCFQRVERAGVTTHRPTWNG